MPETRDYTATKRDTPREYDATLRRVIEESNFAVAIQSTNSPIMEGDTLNVNTLVEETGGLSDTQDVALDVPPGTQVDVESVSLNADGSATITLSWATEMGDAGDYTAEVASEDDTDTAAITVDPAALIWDATDLDNGTDNGVVHESTQNTDYNSDSVIRKGYRAANPRYSGNLGFLYPFHEDVANTSTAHDLSANSRDATINGASTVADGFVGTSALSFDGTDDNVALPQNQSVIDIFNSGTYTLLVWAKTTDTSLGRLWEQQTANTGFHTVIMNNPSTDTLQYYDGDGGNNIEYTDATWHDGNWHLHAFVKDTDNDYRGMYLDGVEKATGSPTSGSASDTGTYFGARPDGTGAGEFDASFAYLVDSALSQSEIQSHYDVIAAASSHETVYKGPSPGPSPTASFASVTIPSGASATLEFLEDTNGDGTADNTDSITMTDATTDYTASGLAGSGELALRVTLSNTDLTVGSTVEVPVEVTG